MLSSQGTDATIPQSSGEAYPANVKDPPSDTVERKKKVSK